ncbi:MAG TPA: AgmX/PglI C-terminal domain-containing protein [Myxococcales bacterium]
MTTTTMTRALALASLLLLVAAAPKSAQRPPPKAALEATRVEEGGVLFVRLVAHQDVEDVSVRVEPTDRLVEFRAMKAGEVRKVAAVGATGAVVATRGLPPIRVDLSAQAAADPPAAAKGSKASGEPLDRTSLTREIQKHTREVRACYEKALPKNPKLSGKLTLEWTLAPSGAVASARIRETTVADPKVGACVLASVKTWKFPASSEETTVAFPFVFRPQ